MYLSESTITFNDPNSYGAGFRFAGVAIEPGTVVTGAYVQFTAAAADGDPVSLRLYGEAVDDAETFTTASFNISSRSGNFTPASVAWNPPAWALGARGPAQQTPDLSGILNEIVSRPGWAVSNALNVIVTFEGGTGTRPVHSFEGSPSLAATLHVSWEGAPPDAYWLGVNTNGNGVVTGGNTLIAAGSNALVQAIADLYSTFAGWSGDTGGEDTNNASISLLMDRERSLTARFIEKQAANGTPERWLAGFYATNDFDAAALTDTDGDGLLAWEEYQAGTDPTNAASVLQVTAVVDDSGTYTIYWSSVVDRLYSVHRCTNLVGSWSGPPIAAAIPGDPSGTNVFPDGASAEGPVFYTIGVRLP